MKRTGLSLLLLLVALLATAQNKTISGSLYDETEKAALPYAVVQLLKPDSTYISGTTTDENGAFRITAPGDGRYIVKASYVGFRNVCRNATITNGSDVDLGQLTFQSNAHALKEITVTASAPKVVLKADTFQYNASAYRVPEGSTIEALVKVLPGAEVGDDGSIKINGKEVKKILVDGKEFMVGDTKTALKNLPTSIIEKVKAYDQQSDLARVTGIDDGEESTVLDFGIKKGMNKGMFSNINLGIGTKSRYSERGMAAYFNDKIRLMGFASANNTNDMGFGGGRRGGFRGVRQGLNAAKMVGLNVNYNDGKTLQWDASVRWNHANGDLNSRVSAENYVARQESFSNRLSQQFTRSNSWDGRFRLEWTPDSAWNIMFRPNIQLSKSDGQTVSTSSAFNEDPYGYTDDPLDGESVERMKQLGLAVNRQQNATISYGDNTSLGGMLQVNRKLGKAGRNATLRLDGSYKDSDSKTFSTQDLEYFLLRNSLGMDSTFQAYRYNLMPAKSLGYAAEATYSEPIAPKTYLQFSYQFKYDFSKSDRSTYDFSGLGTDFFGSVRPAYRSWDSYLSLLSAPLEDYRATGLSRYSEYRAYTHNAQVMLRLNHEKWRMNVGVMFQPQHTTYMQDYLGVHVDTMRNVVNWSPTFDFRYKFDDQTRLRIYYRGTAVQPTMSQLLDIVDNTDPQNVSVGNPGLKPAFENRFRLFYNTYRANHARSVMTFVNFSNTRNAIGNSVTYDAATGARTVRPVNVNGNWNANAAVMFNTSIDSAGVWNVNTFTTGGFNRYASYLQMTAASQLAKNITKSLNLSERLSASYRNSWLEVELNGTVNYENTKNNLQASGNLSTWQFSYGTSISLSLPWNMSLSTDLNEQSRRGYSDASLNTNELIWNAQLSQSFLRNNALTFSLQFYDILHQQSNLSRAINAMGRTDTEYNSINSYVMLRAIYRLNLFGGKDAHPGGPGFGPGGHGGRRPPMGGGRPWGGGRPPHGGGFGGPMGY
ncbi:TonB-dependent receptor [Prevotella dentasini]|uniref:TonB-dependent receptor n=1 Tax=Prevotella dentasini TaxID=589537 RepID=UPI000468FC72|nr:TonB-dependent receptor [Prevotella dentasini]